MARFSLEEIKKIIASKSHGSSLEVTGVSIDSRTIKEGEIFIAIEGPNFDGHDYLAVAKDKGAVAAIVKKGKIKDGLICLEVEDTLKALQQLAAYHRNRYHIPIVAITGSSGKTTTKELVSAILETRYNVLKTEKNFNNEIGLPLTLLQLNETHEACVVELGMRGLGQIRELALIAKPTVGLITNVGTSHLELLGSQEKIAEAKAELIEVIDENGTVILNDDDEYVREMERLACGKVIGYGIESNATVMGSNIMYKKDGLKFTCKCYDELFEVFLPMIGIHNVYNSLGAIAVGRSLGLGSNKIKKGLQNFVGIPMRQEIVSFQEFVIVNDTYNANPSSMKESLRSISQLEGKRKIAILGDMLELGENSEMLHREVGVFISEEKYDILIVYGKDARFIAEEGRAHGIPIVIEVDTHKAAAKAYMNLSEDGDVVLLKGSRGMTMENVLKEIEKIKG